MGIFAKKPEDKEDEKVKKRKLAGNKITCD